MNRLPEEDLEYIFQNTQDIWESLRNKSIFLTGGTGFFGKWLLESLIYVNEKLALNVKVTSLSRNPDLFSKEFPFYNKYSKTVQFVKGDILSYDFNLDEKFQFVIHAATAASDSLNKSDPLLMMDTITTGTKNVLDFAITQPLEGFLFVSSGAIYGKQPWDVTHIKESDSFKIDINNYTSAYAEGKRIAELYSSTYFEKFRLPVKIARCFAFVGPYLPLNTHFAIGNFIQNVLDKNDILIKGNGETVRSYLYASDLVIALLKILVLGEKNKSYNVGSDKYYSLKEIALIIKNIYGLNSKVLDSNLLLESSRYVPSISLINEKLNIKSIVPIENAIKKTVDFYKNDE